MKTEAVVAHSPPEATRGANARSEAKHDTVHVAARQLEAFFLRQLLAETRPQGGGALDGGFAGDTFKQMLDEAIADKMSAAGGIGMAQMFARQLGQAGEVSASRAPSAMRPPNAPGTPAAALPVTHAVATAPTAIDQPLSIDLPPGAPHLIVPVAGRPSSGYGLRSDPVHGGTVNHPGFDLAAATGTQVTAAAAGTVVHAGPAGTYGNLVTLRHDNGFETRYAHLSAVDVQVGDRVEAGAALGKVGSTGYSTGPHLHFEVRHDGQAIDPAPLLPLHRSASRTTR
ncbi:MAG: hypothetical protein E6J91_23395 [Deltaproteobacteria bacterium]|nr:MAG: hypothetical protein E6J91_23395 [Deltaproteobacteria bacterium]